MKIVKSLLEKEVCRLAKEVRAANARLKNAPEGHVKAVDKKHSVECYFRKQEKEKWTYMKKEERKQAELLVQRDYDRQFVKIATLRIHAIEVFLEKYKRADPDNLFQKMSPGRRALLLAGDEDRMRMLPREQFAGMWERVCYKGKQFREGEGEIMTERGERVRSKSEKIIADKLYALGIPYRYECPLVLQGNVIVYPDFTILRADGKEVYLEHFGRMDDPEYVEKTMCKLSTYEKNSIYLGVNLFMTFETGRRVLNTRALDELLRKLFCEE